MVSFETFSNVFIEEFPESSAFLGLVEPSRGASCLLPSGEGKDSGLEIPPEIWRIYLA